MIYEPYINERLDKARKKANNIVNGICETQEDFEMVMRLFLSKRYNIPIFSEYFENLEFDKLVFEVELHKASLIPQEKKTSEIINENKEELSTLFEDWVDEDLSQFKDDDANFMKTGEFKE
jgi:hypothetical protein